MANALKELVLFVVVTPAAFAVLIALTGAMEKIRPQLPPEYSDSDLTVLGSNVKGYAFGTEGLIADWYFMRSLQYIGDKILAKKEEEIDLDDLRSLNPRLLYPMLDNATTLDPHFVAAYSYGAIVLPAIDPQKAIDLAKKGIEQNPQQWRLYQHLAYIYWKLGRYEEAAETYEKGAAIPGATPFMKLMAASMKNKGGSRETARAIYQEMFANAPDENVRITATRRLNELDSLDEREAIDTALVEFKNRNGRCANSFAEVLPLLMSVRLPDNRDFRIDKANNIVDPTGAPYLLDKETCRVTIDPQRSGLPLR